MYVEYLAKESADYTKFPLVKGGSNPQLPDNPKDLSNANNGGLDTKKLWINFYVNPSTSSDSTSTTATG